jgi:hypothetical protein
VLAAAKAEASEQAARLAHLEGEFTALQEMMGEVGGGDGEGVWGWMACLGQAQGGAAASAPRGRPGGCGLALIYPFVAAPRAVQGEQRDMVSRLLSRISTLQCAAAAAEATRRQLHNQMVELRGNVSGGRGRKEGGAQAWARPSGHACRSAGRAHPHTRLTCPPCPRAQIRVFCRVRPHAHSAVRCLHGGTSLALNVDGKEHTFGFDKVFGPQSGQSQVGCARGDAGRGAGSACSPAGPPDARAPCL